MSRETYYALISSLPMLKMQERPAVDSAQFLQMASAFVGGKEFGDLSAVSIRPPEDYAFEDGSFAAKYTAWELALRHSILRLRVQKNQELAADGASVRRDPMFECDADSAAVRAYAAADPLERERILDEARWNKAEELAVSYHFDIDVLCAYRVKLEIAEKWAARAAGDPGKNLDLCANAGTEQKQKETETY